MTLLDHYNRIKVPLNLTRNFGIIILGQKPLV